MRISRSPLIALFLVIFIDTFGYFIVMPVLSRLLIDNQGGLLASTLLLSERQRLFELALALSPLAFILFSPVAGHVSDRFGRKKTIMGCLILSVIGFSLPIFGILQQHIGLLFLGRFICGAGTTNQAVAQAALTDFSSGKERAINLSLIGLAMTLAMVLGPLAGGYLSNPNFPLSFGITTPYLLSVLLSLINIVLLHVAFHETHHPLSRQQRTLTLWQLLTPAHWLLLLSFLLLEGVWSLYYQAGFVFLPRFFEYSIEQVSAFMAYAGLWMCAGLTIVFRVWIRVHPPRTIALTSLIGITATTLILGWFSMPFAHWVCVAPLALLTGCAYPAILQSISEHTDNLHQGFMLGVASTLLGLAWMLTGLGSAESLRHGLMGMLLLCGSMGLIATLLLQRVSRHVHTH